MPQKLKVGIIGSGGIAQGCHIPGYRAVPDDVEIVWACDSNEETARTCAEKFGIPRWTTNYGDVLADGEIGAVSIATPNKFHLQPCLDALAAGKHVLIEKPLAMDGAEARQIVAAADRTDKICQVGFQTRFGGPARFVKQYIDAGRMGDIYYARAQALRRRGVPHWGVFINKELQGGGPLIDIGVHILDLTLFFMGHPKPVSASGRTWNKLGTNPDLVNPWGEYDRSQFTVEDFAVGMIKFDNGAVVVLESSFMANQDGDPFQTQLYGTKSGAIVRAWGDDPVQIFTEQDRQLFNLKPVNVPNVDSSHVEEVKAFVRAILGGEPSPVPARHGMVLNAIFDALYRSSESGREESVVLD